MSVKQNLSVSVFVHKCLMVLNDIEYATFKMFVTQISNCLFVISFQLMFYKTLRFSLATPYVSHGQWKTRTNDMFIMDVREGNFSKKLYFQEKKDWWE